MSKIPSGIQLPNFKKQGPVAVDLMRPGNGTPWEDRGTAGTIAAYFQTVIKSFTSPGLLMDHIRRPETTSDAKVFGMISAAMWFVGVMIWNVYWLYFIFPNSPDYAGWKYIFPTNYWASAFVQAAVVPLGIWLWITVGPKLYRSLAGAELSGVSPTLIYNCFAYSLGPSILAVIPLVPKILPAPFMWVIAALWVHFNLVVAGKRRLYLKGTSAIINVCLIAGAVLIISVAGYYVANLVWMRALDMSGLEAPTPVAKPNH